MGEKGSIGIRGERGEQGIPGMAVSRFCRFIFVYVMKKLQQQSIIVGSARSSWYERACR